MKAMVAVARGAPLQLRELPTPAPGAGEVLVKVGACGVCRTDLHVIDGELANPHYPVIPGHEIVGRVEAVGSGVGGIAVGTRVGIPWLADTCHRCDYCKAETENLCDAAEFTGYTRDGGYATHVIANADYVVRLEEGGADAVLAPLLCAGLIGWRSFTKAGPGQTIGLYGFGAAAHIVAQVALWHKKRIFAFTRTGDCKTQIYARKLGAEWAGDSMQSPPALLDAAIIFAPVGELIPLALRSVKKGGRVVCAGIHMSDIPSFPYNILWNERHILSVANLTRKDAAEFFRVLPQMNISTSVNIYPLERANDALSDMREGNFEGAAVLIP